MPKQDTPVERPSNDQEKHAVASDDSAAAAPSGAETKTDVQESATETKKRPRRSRKKEDAVDAKPEAKSEAKPRKGARKTKPKSAEDTPRADETQAAEAARTESEPAQSPAVPDGMIRIFCNLGRRDGLSPNEIRDNISELAGLLPDDLVDVEVKTRHTFLLVGDEYAEDLIAAVNGEKFGKRSIRVEVAH